MRAFASIRFPASQLSIALRIVFRSDRAASSRADGSKLANSLAITYPICPSQRATSSSLWNDQTLSPEGIRSQYTTGEPNPGRIAPEGYTLDAAMVTRPGNMDIQLDLFLDYANNVKLYPTSQDYF